MSLAITSDQHDLADAVKGLASRHADTARTRAAFDDLAAGRPGAAWQRLVGQELHAVHLPEEFGGVAGLAELAVVTEELGRALVPGPFLATAIASATAVTMGAGGSGAGGSGARGPAGAVDATAAETAGGTEAGQTTAGETTAAQTLTAQTLTELMGQLAEGRTAAVVTGALTARAEGEDWVLSGASDPTISLPGAEVVLVRAMVEGDSTAASTQTAGSSGQGQDGDRQELWFWLRDLSQVSIQTLTGADLTRSLGALELDQYPVGAANRLPGVPAGAYELVRNTLVAAEASGIARWLLDTAVDHLGSRKQFGRLIGSFQALQHRAAMMLVGVETITAAAWDAARTGLGEAERAQRELAAAQAALAGPHRAVDLAGDCIALLGAIGYTWEHDAHLYWRRALQLAAMVGPRATAAQRLGELSLQHHRDFTLVAPDEEPELRAELATILAEAAALDDDDENALVSTGWGTVSTGARRSLLADHGLVAPHFPKPFGRGAGVREQAVIREELARAGIAEPTMVIGGWVLPTLVEFGTDLQRDKLVGPTLRGELMWCQLFSEPGTGSDLAGLSTRATRVEGGWKLSGQKVWTSYAHVAQWGVCLARTDPEAKPHAGLSYFLVDMSSPGVQIRPIDQITGKAEFNEVFLDDAFVPDELVVGEPGDGWKLATTTLTNERLSMGAALDHGSADLVRRAIAEGAVAVDRSESLRVLGKCVSREMILESLAMRAALARIDGVEPGATASVQKLFNALAQRDGSRELTELLGPWGAVMSPEQPYARDHLGVPAILFGGGTIEIQLNVIARRILKLPGEPRR